MHIIKIVNSFRDERESIVINNSKNCRKKIGETCIW